MGSSHSDEGRSSRRIKGLTGSEKKSSIRSSIKESKDRGKRLEKWRKAFENIASSEKFEENKYWHKILADLLHYTKRTTDNDMEWMKDSHFTSITSFTQYSKVSVKEGEIQLTGFDNPSYVEIAPIQTSPKENSIISPLPLPEDRKTLMKNSAMSVQFGQASHIFSSFQEKLSLVHELRKTLLSQIGDPNHVIQGFVNTFKMTCEKLFGDCNVKLDKENYTVQHEEILALICGCCKRFITILTKFTGWIYKEALEMFEHNLDQENLSSFYLLEDVLYEILFRGPNSKLYKIIFDLLAVKYKQEQTKFREVLKQKKNDALATYDEVFATSKEFLLESSTAPYSTAINKLTTLQTTTNPYTKYDITMSIEDEMWNCICQHYKYDVQMQSELRHSFGMDFRLPIFTYCLIQTQCEDLVIHRRFIEEFLDINILDYSFGFTVFKSALDFLLQERNSRKLSDDLQFLAIALSSKRNSLT